MYECGRKPLLTKINIDCTSVLSWQYTVHCDASLTYLPIGYCTWYVLASSSASWHCSHAPFC